jgi:hypothetical protein
MKPRLKSARAHTEVRTTGTLVTDQRPELLLSPLLSAFRLGTVDALGRTLMRTRSM